MEVVLVVIGESMRGVGKCARVEYTILKMGVSMQLRMVVHGGVVPDVGFVFPRINFELTD